MTITGGPPYCSRLETLEI